MSMQAAAGNERACDAVIFDVGNVLIRWDARLVYRRLLPDEASIEAFFAEVGFMDWNLEFDRGADWDEGVATLSARHPHRAELIAAFHARWHESVEGAVEGAEALLAELAARGVPLYAITNFAGPKWTESVARFPFLGTSFRDVVVSGHEGVVKPDPEIFRRCLARNRLEARTCVFVDDSPANVAAAAAVGLDAIRFTSVEALHPELARRGLL
jgi:2-haloacid dehalogenase